MSAKPRNVIILTSDEMRGDAPSFMGNADCRTPSLDRFAGRGVVFDRHFTVHGKCVPSRIAMVTGRYPHTDGFRTIQQHLPSDQPNLLGRLKALGYESAVFGHNHVWEDFWGVENRKGTGYVDYHSYTAEHFAPMLKREWPAPAPGPGAATPMHMEEGYDYSGRIDKPISGFCDHNRAEQAVEYLTRVRDRSRPFYLHVNFGSPHPRYQAEEPWFSMYRREALRAWPHELPRGAPLPLQRQREIRTDVDAHEAALREIQAVYYAMCSRVDSHIGRVLETIEREGLFEDSVVLFTTDHGDFAGQYGLVEKWDTCMADCILHTPCILHAPTLPHGVRVDSLSEHTDLAPTLLALLGIEPDWGVHGESLLPVIAGRRRKEAVFADGGHEEEMWRRFNPDRKGPGGKDRPLGGKQETYRQAPETMARTKMVRTERWKLVVRLTGGNELYDLAADPWELDNLWGRADLSPVVLDLQQKLIEWCLRTDTDRPFQPDVGA